MKVWLVLAFAAALASCASPQGRGADSRQLQFAPNPTNVLTLDIAMNREAQDAGVYDAMAQMAANRAVIFVPQPVSAEAWLRDQPVRGLSVSWEPHRVILSCDGKTGVTTGAFEAGETAGYYTTVWQYFASSSRPSDGEWRWVLSHSAALDIPRKGPKMLQTQSASCDGTPNVAVSVPQEGTRLTQTQSADQSLSYSWLYRPDGSREIVVKIWDGAQHNAVLTDVAPAPGDAPMTP